MENVILFFGVRSFRFENKLKSYLLASNSKTWKDLEIRELLLRFRFLSRRKESTRIDFIVKMYNEFLRTKGLILFELDFRVIWCWKMYYM